MSLSVTASPVAQTRASAPRPRFFGVLRGELFKIAKQRSNYIMALLLAGVIFLPYLVTIANSDRIKAFLTAAPLAALYREMGSNLLVLRVFAGPILILVTARLIGMEYSNGTIRVLLSRGVGRLQLLGAKLMAVGIVALVILVGGLLINLVLAVVMLSAVMGNLNALKALDSGFWQDALVYTGTIAISMGVTILMAAALAVLGRSLAFGLSAGLIFFPADNIGIIFFALANLLTKSDAWLLATGDLLGPNLNVMAHGVLPARAAGAAAFGLQPPLVPVDGAHTLLVTALWTAAFVAVAVGLTWKRDVTQ
ncbi:MAG: ABC transporter permease [Ktedonobacterales bacterium]|nr:ABC transporter permease [Ktedonobacterales bacterium]